MMRSRSKYEDMYGKINGSVFFEEDRNTPSDKDLEDVPLDEIQGAWVDPEEDTPRLFRNALYDHLVANGVPTETASTIAGEAEIYADGYDAFQQRGVEFAARQMGFQLTSPKFGGEQPEEAA